jgi:hypothetical protein
MTTALTILMTGTLCCVCFLIGAKVGQKVSNGERVELPSANPLRMVKESRERKQTEMEQDKLDTILRNIERYDGTAMGQEDVM